MYKSNKRSSVLASRILILTLLTILVFVGRGVWGLYVKQHDTLGQLKKVRLEHDELTQRSVFLEGEIERLSTTAGVEQEIREQYGLAKEGERVFIIVDPESESTGTTTDRFWSKWIFWREQGVSQ